MTSWVEAAGAALGAGLDVKRVRGVETAAASPAVEAPAAGTLGNPGRLRMCGGSVRGVGAGSTAPRAVRYCTTSSGSCLPLSSGGEVLRPGVGAGFRTDGGVMEDAGARLWGRLGAVGAAAGLVMG